jgi:hypothetical protein
LFRKDASDYNSIKYVSERKNPVGNTGRYQYAINGVLTPSIPVTSDAEAWSPVQKAFHAYGSLEHMGIVMDGTWGLDEGKYLIATDLESQGHKSMFSHNGIDVSTSVSHLTVNFDTALDTSVTVDVFSHYDGFIVVGADGLVNVFY